MPPGGCAVGGSFQFVGVHHILLNRPCHHHSISTNLNPCPSEDLLSSEALNSLACTTFCEIPLVINIPLRVGWVRAPWRSCCRRKLSIRWRAPHFTHLLLSSTISSEQVGSTPLARLAVDGGSQFFGVRRILLNPPCHQHSMSSMLSPCPLEDLLSVVALNASACTTFL